MNKMLWALYEGEISPAEQYLAKSEEYLAMRQEHCRHYEDFIKKLGSPLDEEFRHIMEEQVDTLPFEFGQMFIDGFRLGAKMIIEVYEDDRGKK